MFSRLFGRKVVTGKRGEPMPANNDGLPDSSNPAGRCPRCNKQSSFQIIGTIPVTFDGGHLVDRDGTRSPTFNEQVSVLVCHSCQQGVTVIEEMWIGEYRKTDANRKGGGTVWWKGIHWWPLGGMSAHSSIPDAIADALNEATMALAAKCPRAAAAMARRTLEAITCDQGETTGVLAQRLANLAKRNILLPTLADWASEVRLIGNKGAHFDLIDQVTEQDATQLIEFIRELIKYLYILPYDLNARRSANP